MADGKVTLGADASVAAGPVGRTAAATTDSSLNAQVLSYSRSEGIFAGVALDGSVLAIDDKANESAYGVSGILPSQIMEGKVGSPPPSAQEVTAALTKATNAPTAAHEAGTTPTAPAAPPAQPSTATTVPAQARSPRPRSRWKRIRRREPAARVSGRATRRRPASHRPGSSRPFRRARNSQRGSSPGTAGGNPRRSRTSVPPLSPS